MLSAEPSKLPELSVLHFDVHRQILGNNGQLIGLLRGLNEVIMRVNQCKTFRTRFITL